MLMKKLIMGLKLGQINVGRSMNAMVEIRRYLDSHTTQIICIQEPYVQPSTSWPGCRLFYGAGPDENIWSLTVVRDPTLSVVLNGELSTKYCTVLEVVSFESGIEFVIVNSYFRYNQNIEPHLDKLDSILNFYKDKYVVIAADVNARSFMWHNTLDNDRGQKLETFMLIKDITLHNVESEITTFENARGQKSNIDVTMSAGRQMEVFDWTISRQSFLSDHRLITFSIESLVQRRSSPGGTSGHDLRPKINLRNIDWRVFDATLNVDLGMSENFDERSLDGKVEELTRILQRAEHDSAPLYKSNRITPRWWSRELDELRQEKTQKERKLQKARKKYGPEHEFTLGLRLEFSRSRTKYVNALRYHKKRSWLELVKTSSDEDPWGIVYKILMGKMKKSTQMVSLKLDNRVVTHPTEIARLMMDGLLPDDTADNSEDLVRTREQSETPILEWENEIVSMEELANAVKKQKSGKAPGLDGVRAEVIKRALCRVGPPLLSIVREVFSTAEFPKSWKQGSLKVFLKSTDKPIDNIKSYRPITLLPVMGKIVERIIAERLKDWLARSNYLGECQHGFVSGRSTTTAMLTLKEEVAESRFRYVLGVFLDISGAFDNAWWPMIIQSLKINECPAGLLKLLKSYLTDRSVEFQWNGARVTKGLTKGCPQGSILGPLLWNVMFETLLKMYFGNYAKVIAYADDVVLLIHGMSRVELEISAQYAVNVACGWSSISKLTFSQLKTQLLLLKGSLHKYRRPRIYMNGVRLKFEDNVRYLGVKIEEGMCFDTHIRETLAKAKKVTMSLMTLSRTSGGYGCDSLRSVYKGMTVPLLTYGCELWGAAAVRKKALIKVLLRAQRQILLRVIKAYRTVSAEACTVIAGVVPLDLVIREKCDISTDVWNGMDRTESKRIRRQETLAIWQARWSDATKGRETYQYFPSITDRLKLKTEWDHYTTQCLSGHGNFRQKLNYFKLKDSPWCEECGPEVEDTAWHTLAVCQTYDEARRDITSILTGDELADKLFLVSKENVKTFISTARKVLKIKESRGRDQDR